MEAQENPILHAPGERLNRTATGSVEHANARAEEEPNPARVQAPGEGLPTRGSGVAYARFHERYTRGQGHNGVAIRSPAPLLRHTDGSTALMGFAAKNNAEAIRQALRDGADVNAVNAETGDTATAVACRLAHVEALEALIEGGVNLFSCTRDGRSAAMVAVEANRRDILKKLWELLPKEGGVSLKAWVDQQAPDGATAMHFAAAKNALEALDCLLWLGASVDIQDHAGKTPIHTAAINGRTDACRTLVSGGSKFVDEALLSAVASGRCQLAYTLVDEYGAKDPIGIVLAHAIDADAGLLCMILTHRGASPTHLPLPLGTGMPVHCAALRKCWSALAGLLRGGASINQRNPVDGTAALHQACKAKDLGLVLKLIEMEADVNAQTHDGDTPLHEAACQAHWEAIVVLLNAGADFTLRDHGRARPIDLVAEGGVIAECNCGAVCACERACFDVLHFVQFGAGRLQRRRGPIRR